MPFRRDIAGSLGVVLATITLTMSLWPGAVKAQTDSWTSPYPLILTPERAAALVQSADRKLGYVPGEVLVKFKPGVTPNGQERALSVLRSRPSVRDLKWIGDVALLRDKNESDATILAFALSRQPEIAYAEPNYLYQTTATPNDPGFAELQWNFRNRLHAGAAIDLPGDTVGYADVRLVSIWVQGRF